MMVDSVLSYGAEVWGTQPPQESKSIVDPTYYGRTFEAPIIVFDDDSFR